MPSGTCRSGHCRSKASQPKTFQSLRILIVEDEIVTSLDLAETLREYGHEVVGIAHDAGAALACAERTRPDLVLMDINLNGFDAGIDAAVALRDAHDIRSLFVTAHTDPATRDRAQAAWPLGLVAKPIQPAKLRVALQGAAGTLAAVAARYF